MSERTINYAATFKPKCMAMCVLALNIVHLVEGVLTEGTSVTADSV